MTDSPRGYAWPVRDPHPGHDTYLFDRVRVDALLFAAPVLLLGWHVLESAVPVS